MKSESGVVAGIDLGTNNSCIAVYKSEEAEVLAGADGSRITPSVVYIAETGERHVGKSAKNYGHKKPERYFYDIKRFFAAQLRGEFYKEYKDYWTFEMKRDTTTGYCNYLVDKKEIFTPEQISANVLRKLVSYVEEGVKGAVLTVPAYFSSEQKNKILEAAKLADLEVLQLICEPTAAAIAYGMEHSYVKGEKLVVFDMGSGKLDIAVIKVENATNFTTIAIGGDPHLGGKSFDAVIMKWMLKEMKYQGGKTELAPALKYKLMEMAEEAKEALSYNEATPICLNEIDDNCKEVSLTRQMFEELSTPIMEKIKDAVQNTLKAQCQIYHVLLIGGATKTPMIMKMLKDYLTEATFSQSANTEYLVSLGATRLAAKLGGQSTRADIKDLEIQDVTSLMIGVEIYENGETRFRKIFDSMTPYGSETVFTMITTEDNQIRCESSLYEGLSDDVSKSSYSSVQKFWHKMFSHHNFISNKLPPEKAGEIKVNIRLKIDRNGILTMATENSNYTVHYKTQFKSKK